MYEYEHKMRLDTEKLLRGDRDVGTAAGKSTTLLLSPVQRVKPQRHQEFERKE